MDKPTKKRQSYNVDILILLANEFDVSQRFVKMSINKERQSRTADNIRKKYLELTRPTEAAIENFKNNLS
ncbi:hypothetical protein [Chryseobacterium sp.]|uniref:hypothetical protein n=1 Tax=Chryseobacterium sp. TaxID=1871047 RepID=UPI002FC8F174